MADDKEILIRIRSDIKDLEKGLATAKKDIANFGEKSEESLFSLENVASTALGFGVAQAAGMAASAVKDFAIESVRASLEFERALASLEIQTGNTADVLINDLRVASKGVVSDLDLVATANKALALGISRNQLPELMEVASARAKVMGISVTQAFGDISIGIGRQSKLILDNLGIIVDLDKAYANYADQLGKSASSLTDFEKKAALTNQILIESRGITAALNAIQADHLTSIERISASWQNLKLGAGDFLVQTFDDISYAFKEMNMLMTDTVPSETAQEQLRLLGQEAFDLQKQMMGAQEAIKNAVTELDNLKNIKITGEASFSVEEQKAKNDIDMTQLELLKNQRDQRAQINDLLVEGISSRDAEAFISQSLIDKENELKAKYDAQVEALRILQLERQTASTNEVDLLIKEKQAELEKTTQSEQTLAQIKAQAETSLQSFLDNTEAAKGYAERLREINTAADGLKDVTRELEAQEKVMRSMSGLSKSSALAGGAFDLIGKGISVYIDKLQGTDPDDMSDALQSKLKNTVSGP